MWVCSRVIKDKVLMLYATRVSSQHGEDPGLHGLGLKGMLGLSRS